MLTYVANKGGKTKTGSNQEKKGPSFEALVHSASGSSSMSFLSGFVIASSTALAWDSLLAGYKMVQNSE